MSKSLIITIILVVVALTIIEIGIPRRPEKTEKGVLGSSNYKAYLVALPDGAGVADYFALSGDERWIDPLIEDISDGSVTKYERVFYSQTLDGGWVIYNHTKTKGFVYVPSDTPYQKIVQFGCDFAEAMAEQTENFLNIEEAKKYIPSLGK